MSNIFLLLIEAWSILTTLKNIYSRYPKRCSTSPYREAKYKRALREHFLTHFIKTFAAFSHRKLKVTQIWSTHQSKVLIFYFGMKKFGVRFLKILWETDKVHFTCSNLVCVYTHLNFKIWNLVCLFSTKFSKIQLENFFRSK